MPKASRDAEVIQVNSDDEVISLDSEDEIVESVAQADTVWLDDVANVTVDVALLGDLEAEAQGTVELTSFTETEAGQRCPLCPWRCFQRRSNVLHHIKNTTPSGSSFVAPAPRNCEWFLPFTPEI